jgi:hypothetical protein
MIRGRERCVFLLRFRIRLGRLTFDVLVLELRQEAIPILVL